MIEKIKNGKLIRNRIQFQERKIMSLYGKYVYSLRHADDDFSRIVSIEKNMVYINHYADVILDEPLEFSGKDSIKISKDVSKEIKRSLLLKQNI